MQVRDSHRFLFLLPLVLLTGCNSISRQLVEWKKRQYREAARFSEHSIFAAGHDVIYCDREAKAGAAERETMVLLHGFATDKDNWTLFAKHIPDSYRVIAPDLPGFGHSSRHAEERYDVRTQATRLLALIDALGLSRFHLAGNSMGGNIAARFAIDHPERVRSLALIDSAGVKSPQPSKVAQAISAGQNPLLLNSVDDFDRILAQSFVRPPDIPGFLKRYLAEQALLRRPFNDKIFADMRERPDRLEGELARLTVPTLIMWGDTDHIIDVSAAEVFHRGIAESTLVVIKECGHAPMIEHPAEAAEKYLNFLRAIPAH